MSNCTLRCCDCSFSGALEEFLSDTEKPRELVEIFEDDNCKYRCPNCDSEQIESYEIL